MSSKYEKYAAAKVDAESCLSDFYDAVLADGRDFSDELKDLVYDATQGAVRINVE